MKIALSVLNDKISPRFDSTYKFIIVSVKNGKINVKEDIVLSTTNSSKRVKELADMDIDTIICGEINSYTLSRFGKKGINVIPSTYLRKSAYLYFSVP